MVAQTMPLHARLAELREAAQAARVRAREVEQGLEAARAEVARLREEAIEASSQGDEGAFAKAQAKRAKAQAAVDGEWADRTEGARRAAARSQAAHDAFVVATFGKLIGELRPDARELVERFEEWRAAGRELVREWTSAQQHVSELALTAGRARETRVPDLELRSLVRDLGRAAPVLPPLPQEWHATTATVIPQHDPDPEVSEPARAKIRAEAAVKAGGRA